MKRILLILLVSVMLISCDYDTSESSNLEPATNSIVDDTYSYYTWWEGNPNEDLKLETTFEFKMYRFNDDKCIYKHEITTYTHADGYYNLKVYISYSWYTSGDYIYLYDSDTDITEIYEYQVIEEGIIIDGLFYLIRYVEK